MDKMCDFGCGNVATYYKFPSEKTPNGRYSCCVSPNSCPIKREKTVGDKNPSRRPEIRKKISEINKIIFSPGSEQYTKQQEKLVELYGVTCPSKIPGMGKKISENRKRGAGYQYQPAMNSQEANEKRTITRISKGIQVPDEQLPIFTLYRRKVRKLTELNYQTYTKQINPMGLLRGRRVGEHQLDHIMSIHRGFIDDISPEIISHPANLRIVTSTENKMKSRRSEYSIDELMEKIDMFNMTHNNER
jgi:hypothetical protein